MSKLATFCMYLYSKVKGCPDQMIFKLVSKNHVDIFFLKFELNRTTLETKKWLSLAIHEMVNIDTF